MQTNSSLPIVGYTKTLFLLSKEGGSVAWLGGSRLARHKNRTMKFKPYASRYRWYRAFFFFKIELWRFCESY